MSKLRSRALTTWPTLAIYLLITGFGWAGMPCCGVMGGWGSGQNASNSCNHGSEATTNAAPCPFFSIVNEGSMSCSCDCCLGSITEPGRPPQAFSVIRVSHTIGVSVYAMPSLTTLSPIDFQRARFNPLGPNKLKLDLTCLHTVLLTC